MPFSICRMSNPAKKNMDSFEILLGRYLNHTASKEEIEELFELIKTGSYDDLLGNNIVEMLQNEMLSSASPRELERMEGVYDSRLREKLVDAKVKVLRLHTWLAAAAMVAGVLFGTWWLLNARPDQERLSSRKESTSVSAADQHLVRFTDKQLIHLPDGSTVLLNQGSELTYDQEDFGRTERGVTLTGEGFFDVKHDPAKPFIVHTGKIRTTVLGTAFNVTAAAGGQQVGVTVTRGRVKVGDETKTYDVITPDQQIVVNTATREFTIEHVNAKLVAGWKDRFIILDNVTMKEAVAVLAERFDVRLTLTNPDLEKCHVSASFFNGEDVEHILKVIAGVNQLSYAVHVDGTITLDGGAPCK